MRKLPELTKDDREVIERWLKLTPEIRRDNCPWGHQDLLRRPCKRICHAAFPRVLLRETGACQIGSHPCAHYSSDYIIEVAKRMLLTKGEKG